MAQQEEAKAPKGWAITHLSNVSVANSGVGFPKKHQGIVDGDIPVYKVGDVSKSFQKNEICMKTSEFYVTEDVKKEMKGKIFPVGSTLFAKIGEALRLERRVILGKEGLADNNVMAVTCDLNEMNRFVYQYLRTVKLAEFSRSSTVPSIRKGDVELLNLPLPPLPEQKRIVEKLDSLLAQVDTIQQRLNNLPDIIKRFRQSVLAAAVSGKLTEQWRDSSDIAQWKQVKLGDVGKGFNYGSSTKSEKEGRVPVLRMGNIQSGKLDWEKLVYTSDPDEIKKYKLNKYDVVFNRTNSPELVGKTAIYLGEKESIFAGYLIRVQGSERLDALFLNFLLNSPKARAYCREVKTDGVSQSNINAQKLKALEFNLPPMTEQTEIVRLVEQYFALADTLEKNLANAKQRVDNLTQSILAKAFRGELVPQDPNDEPADKLLARIKAARLEAEMLEKAAKKAAKASKK